MDPNAILFYGYCWNDEIELFEGGDDGGWRDRLLRLRGVKNPWDDYAGKGWVAENEAAINAYRESEKAVEAEFDCDTGRHGCYDSSLPHVLIKSSKIQVEWGESAAIDPMKMAGERQDWDDALERFLCELGIAKPDGQDRPQWWLVSYYG